MCVGPRKNIEKIRLCKSLIYNILWGGVKDVKIYCFFAELIRIFVALPLVFRTEKQDDLVWI